MMPPPSSPQPTPDGTSYDAGGGTPHGAAPCQRLEIEKTANGGFTAQKFCAPQGGKSDMAGDYASGAPEKFAFTSGDELLAFVGESFDLAPEAPASDVDTQTAAQGPPAPLPPAA